MMIIFAMHHFTLAPQRGRNKPGGTDPEQPLLVTNRDFSRRSPSGASPVFVNAGLLE